MNLQTSPRPAQDVTTHPSVGDPDRRLRPRRHPWYLYVPLLFLGMTIGGIVVGLSAMLLRDAGIDNVDAAVSLASVFLSGAAGGILYAIRASQLRIPRLTYNDDVELGWLSDCAFGIAGAFVVFMVTPQLSESVPGFGSPIEDKIDWIEVIAVALVGGYAGRSLLESASDSFGKVKRELRDTRDEFVHRSEHLEQRLNEVREEFERSTRALAIAEQQLNPDDPSPSSDELAQAIRQTGYETKAKIFLRARRHFLGDMAGSAAKVLPIFETLVAADEHEQYHESRALLARVYGALEKWDVAQQWITKACEIRDEHGIAGFRRYEEYLARCIIECDPHFTNGLPSNSAVVEKVVSLLRAAHPDDPSFKRMVDERIRRWLSLNVDGDSAGGGGFDDADMQDGSGHEGDEEGLSHKGRKAIASAVT